MKKKEKGVAWATKRGEQPKLINLGEEERRDRSRKSLWHSFRHLHTSIASAKMRHDQSIEQTDKFSSTWHAALDWTACLMT